MTVTLDPPVTETRNAFPETALTATGVSARILLVDDDRAVARAIDRALRLEGYGVVVAEMGNDALEFLAAQPFDAVILDLQLPDIDGLEICRRLRAAGNDTPILMLTGRVEIDDRVAGLDAGADDYLVKPFALPELLARLRVLLRRRAPAVRGEKLSFSDLTLNLSTREGQRAERKFSLTRIEYDLLEILLRHPSKVLTREVLLHEVWGFDFDSDTNSLAVYIGYLRRKLEAQGEERLIHTVRGVGYVMREPEPAEA